MVKLGPWPKGDGDSGYGKAGTVAIGDRNSGEIYSWDRGQKGDGDSGYGKAGTVAIGYRDSGEVYSWDHGQKKGTGKVGILELVRWPLGTGTANEYIAGTAPRSWNSKLECYGFIDGGCSMEGDGLRAEGEFLVLFGLCREQLENRVLETALVLLCSARENHEGGEYDVMILATVQRYFLLFRGGI